MTKIVSVQYPSGGFGHFMHVILSTHCKKFNGKKINYKFGPGGDSHNYPVGLPKYHKLSTFNKTTYQQCLNNITSEYSTVLIDSGIDNDSNEFQQIIIPNISIRVCYNDWTWPLLARMFYTRCMSAVNGTEQNINQWIFPLSTEWECHDAAWAKREKFFLYLRDHEFRYSWRENHSTLNIPIDYILDYSLLKTSLEQFFVLDDFDILYQHWYQTNYKHFKFFLDAKFVWDNLHNRVDLSHITDLFTQSLVYYYIWLKYNIETPHNDYHEWFTNTKDIIEMLNNQGVEVDSN